MAVRQAYQQIIRDIVQKTDEYNMFKTKWFLWIVELLWRLQ